MRQSVALVIVLLWGLRAATPTAAQQLRGVPYVSGLNLPIEFVQDPSNNAIQYVAEQKGLIRVIRNGLVEAAPFLDVSALLSLGGERGLLGLAFPRDYGTSGRFYIYFTRGSNLASEVGDIVVARYRRSVANPLIADPASRKDLIFNGLPYIEHTALGNHNGGHLAFGPDGYLYIAIGDGGGGDDPFNNAQNPATLLGKMLRIDVSVADADVTGFRVPADNPFLDNDPVAALPQIWAVGLRNPWKFSFDDLGTASTNALIIGDVGQAAWEEIDYEPANAGGRNYGWRNREGNHDNQGNVFNPVSPAYQPLVDPVFEYSHAVGGSITGGYVYRGTGLRASFRGRYFFADFVRGRVWSLGLSVNSVTREATAVDLREHTDELGGTATIGAISSMGRDAQGEIYVVGYGGTIFKIVDVTPLTDVDVIPFNYDADGRKDLFLYNRITGTWTIKLGTSANTFAEGPAGAWTPSWNWQIFVADFNGDNLDDFFLYSFTRGIFFKVINTGSGFSYFSQEWLPGFSVFIVDFNGDGRSDVFIYNAATGVWYTCVSTGAGTGGFAYGGGGWIPGWQVFPADFDGDGRSDFLLYHSTSGLFFKAISRGLGQFQYSSGAWTPGWVPVIAELNGDEHDDVFLYHPGDGTFFRCNSMGDGTGAFEYASGGWATGWTVRAANFDGDGLTDLFLYNGSVFFKVLNTGGGFSYFGGGWAEWATDVTDLNGDARSDVLLHDRPSGVWFEALTTDPWAFRYTNGAFR